MSTWLANSWLLQLIGMALQTSAGISGCPGSLCAGGDVAKAVEEVKDAINQNKVNNAVHLGLRAFEKYMKLPGGLCTHPHFSAKELPSLLTPLLQHVPMNSLTILRCRC